MTADDLLPRLDAVRSRGAGRWSARCPAHADTSPSLSVSVGDKGLLLKCWAGCSVNEITAALGLRVSDLFADADESRDRQTIRDAQRRRAHDQARREREALADEAVLDARREAERLIRSARGIDTSGWSEAQRDAALEALADAFAVVETEQREDYVYG